MNSKALTAVPSFLSYLCVKMFNVFPPMFTDKNPSRTKTERMIVLGIHVSGVIGCDEKPLSMPRNIAVRYFNSIQAREAIESCIKQAKDNPLQRHIPNKIKVQVSAAVGMAIKSGEIDSIMGLKIFLESVKKETSFITMIGGSLKADQIIYL